MNEQLVMTVLGPDRPGIVEALAEKVRECQGSWRESRLAHLQDQFAGIIEVSLPAEQRGNFEASLKELRTGLKLQCQVSRVRAPKTEGKRVRLEFIGQDRPGIVFAVSDLLHDLDVNVESMDTRIQSAPMSGEILFRAEFQVRLPERLDMGRLEQGLAAIGEDLMLDVQIDN